MGREVREYERIRWELLLSNEEERSSFSPSSPENIREYCFWHLFSPLVIWVEVEANIEGYVYDF